MRKKNAAVLLATQNLSDIFNSKIRDVVLESCPTKVLLPNAEAGNPAQGGELPIWSGCADKFTLGPAKRPDPGARA